jgi:hypothetical protein
MDTKTLIGGLIAGVAFFLLGWLIYGMLLMDIMAPYGNPACMRPEAEMSMVMMILSNLVWGWVFALILSKWPVSNFSNGASAGAILGGALALAIDLGMYAYSTMYNSMTGIAIDVVANVVMCAIVGGIIGWWFGRN